jgi:hypothetical protein
VLCLNLAMVFVPLFGLVALFAALTFVDALSSGSFYLSRSAHANGSCRNCEGGAHIVRHADEHVLVPAALAAFFTSVGGLLSLIATGT